MELKNLRGKTILKTNAPKKRKVLGLCLGASTISIARVEMEQDPCNSNEVQPNIQPKVVEYQLLPHEGDPKRTLISIFQSIDLDSLDGIAATGRRFRKFINLSSIPEPEAVEYAYQFVKSNDSDRECSAVVSAGGETFMVYVLNRIGQISNVLTGNKCASGTGEFFLQQLRRMNVSLQDAVQWAATETPHHVSGRCSVFCKSDCTHATNKGVPRAKVIAGLCKMMAQKILELIKNIPKQNIMIVGGTALNPIMIEYLHKEISGLIVPKEAPYFEALGAALWALQHETAKYPGISNLFRSEISSFEKLEPLRDFEDMVEFKTLTIGVIQPGDECVLGLDVGSTTTKAVVLRKRDDAMLASIYLRTNGDPVEASRKCYRSIFDQIKKSVDPAMVLIEGLGICGSGRQIAGLHALTDGIINEIIAHATAAVHFDSQVDTIFEIGGQDAKYTYITNSVASDYAMNEACSAGTGSFLEESAHETLGVKMEDIGDIALKGQNPPNFNDQCAAFIASDIKNAIHEGVEHEDIVAGLVYSICMNYSNRVKGHRPVGEKVFMQGGVCYNKAVPLAMAALIGKPIIVPPEPGLMGAYGVALEVKKRIETGLIQKKSFDLETLFNREVQYGKTFICRGGKEKCDRHCEIARIEIENRKYPFGGACNKYYNLRHNIKCDLEKLDLVRIRQHLIFEKYGGKIHEYVDKSFRGRVAINKSFLVNTYYPLYSTFFTEIGFQPVLPTSISQEGIDQKGAAFCYPMELAHGFFNSLLEMENIPEIIFLPHFKAIPTLKDCSGSQVCPLVQGETFTLQTTFHKKIKRLKRKGIKILSPLMDLTEGIEDARKPLIETALLMGVSKQEAQKAFRKALSQQTKCFKEMKAIGQKALKGLEADPDQTGVVIFARPYNGFVEEAHMGIPHKFASRGVLVIPLDFLQFDNEEVKRHMYWGMGQIILKAGQVVKRHPQLFGNYITNFSCGPDSFIVGYFRNIMGRKPSLTLELDSHTADAGLETRIEAFLDIITAYRKLVARKKVFHKTKSFVPAQVKLGKGIAKVITSSGKALPITDARVKLLLPSMGKIATESLAAVFRIKGFNAIAHPPSDENVLKIGRANASCKECLPLILNVGTLLNYTRNDRGKDEVLIYFLPTTSGPCRFGQYSIFMEDLIKRLELPNIALLSLTSENSYGGLGSDFQLRGWWAVVVSDTMEDIRSMLLANAKDVPEALEIFNEQWNLILKKLENGNFADIEKQLAEAATQFSRIPLQRPVKDVPVISLAGEIFVRRDGLSRQYLTERLGKRGFATICSPVAEWILYSDYLVDRGLVDYTLTKMGKLKFWVRKKIMARYEKRLKSILSCSGLIQTEPIDIKKIIHNARPYISDNLTGETILTVGSSLGEVVSHTCGVIAVGPFGCMPNRLAEAILNTAMNRENKLLTDPNNGRLRKTLQGMEDLPFLAIESDGSPFPQLIDAKLESFCLRAERLHRKMLQYH